MMTTMTTTLSERGERIAAEFFEEIASSYRLHFNPALGRLEGAGKYKVPSESRGEKVYDVTHTSRARSCTCLAFENGPHGADCKHLFAVAIVKRATAVCEGCGRRFRHRELFEVEESLTHFEGDRLCEECVYDMDAEVA